jgi:hypothetical protein
MTIIMTNHKLALSFICLLIALTVSPALGQTHSNTLSWTWSQGTGDPAAGFHVWRAAPTTGTTCPTMAATGTPYAVVAGSTSTGYVDTAVVAGNTLCYAVTAYNTGGDSALSNVVSGSTPFSVPANPPNSVSIVSK